MKKYIAVFGLALALTACADQPAPPMQTGKTLPPKIVLNVQAITLTDRTGIQPAGSPYNNNHFTPTISDAIKQWASDRLQAAGGTGNAIIIVKDASLNSQMLPLQHGMDTWFTRQQSVKYTAHAEVTIEANGVASGAQTYAAAEATASRSVTLPENPTDVEKQNAYYSLLNGLMKDLGQNLESSIQTHMGTFIGGSTGNVSMLPDRNAISTANLQIGLAPQIADVTASPRTAQNSSLAGVANEQAQMPAAPVFGVSTLPPVAKPMATSALADSALQPQASYDSASNSAGPVTIPLSGSMTR